MQFFHALLTVWMYSTILTEVTSFFSQRLTLNVSLRISLQMISNWLIFLGIAARLSRTLLLLFDTEQIVNDNYTSYMQALQSMEIVQSGVDQSGYLDFILNYIIPKNKKEFTLHKFCLTQHQYWNFSYACMWPMYCVMIPTK